jgi:4-hydroxy-2-oxoheptanedioate aldolase
MKLPVNHFKRRLALGEVQYGLWLGLPDATSAEICAGAGFDWLLIDSEHAPFDLQTILSALRAMAPHPSSAIVRPVVGDVNLIKQLLDIGAQTLLVPMIDTADQAELMARAVRYPPEGIRGLGSSLARAAQWNQIPGYLTKANSEICLLVQVETVKALENLDDILKVQGVDGVFIGPSDLSASMGYIGDAGHPEVVAAIDNAITRIRASGKAAGLLSMDPALSRHYIEQGATYVGVGVDTLLLSQGARRLVAEFRGTPVDSAPKAGY